MPKEAVNLRLFPRGFLGAEIRPQIERTPQPFADAVARQQFRVQDFKTVDSDLFANPHVEALYAKYIKQSATTGDFSFREQILKVALEAFGTMNFEFWFLAQFKSPACGDLHNRFLTDTLRFISEGRREMALETWGALLTITDEGDQVGAIGEYARDYFGMDSNRFVHGRRNTTLVDVLQQWCSHPNGMEDLLGTLHLLFGNP
jgi:hypothetical protein